MSATNQTNFLALPQFTVVDKPSWVGDFNCAMEKIDTGVSKNATGVTEAKQAAATADAKAVAAQTTANNATTLANQGISAAAKAQAEAELAHQTADGAVTRLNNVDESIEQINNKNTQQDTAIQDNLTQIETVREAIDGITVPNFSYNGVCTVRASGGASLLMSECKMIGNSIIVFAKISFTGFSNSQTQILSIEYPSDAPFTYNNIGRLTVCISGETTNLVHYNIPCYISAEDTNHIKVALSNQLSTYPNLATGFGYVNITIPLLYKEG